MVHVQLFGGLGGDVAGSFDGCCGSRGGETFGVQVMGSILFCHMSRAFHIFAAFLSSAFCFRHFCLRCFSYRRFCLRRFCHSHHATFPWLMQIWFILRAFRRTSMSNAETPSTKTTEPRSTGSTCHYPPPSTPATPSTVH